MTPQARRMRIVNTTACSTDLDCGLLAAAAAAADGREPGTPLVALTGKHKGKVTVHEQGRPTLRVLPYSVTRTLENLRI